MSKFRSLIEGYDVLEQEMAVCEKYGHDYRSEKGRTRAIVERLHPKRLELKVADIIQETPTTRTLRLVARKGVLPPFQAGQYINLFVNIDGINTSRPYSISSSPWQTGYYEITVRRVENGLVSNYLLDKVKAGSELESSGPAGYFCYNPLFHGKKLCFIAGGSGITPFMSMIRETLQAGLDRQIHLIYGNRDLNDVLFHDKLKNLSLRYDNFSYDLVLSDPPAGGYKGLSGLIDARIIQEALNGEQMDMFYICGPTAMYEYCLEELGKMGIPRRKIRREMSSSYEDVSKNPAWPAGLSPEQSFTVRVGEREIKAKAGEALLTSLEREGIKVPVSCRCGECSYCRVKLLKGEVFQPAGVLLRESDRRYGYIHSCKAYPLSDLEILV